MEPNKVLIVDDEPMARDIIEGFLYQEGYDLHFADSGLEALDMLPRLKPDIILLDVMMPDMDGFEVCRRLKASERWRHIPVILVTALGEKTDLARGFEAGADDFLTKPVNDIELRSRVRAMLRIKEQYDELEATLRLREDLSHMIVHDMKSPVSAIVGFSELLIMKGIPAKYKPDVDKIHEQALALSAFLNDMLIMAKMESDRLVLNCSKVNIGDLIQAGIQGHQPLAELKNVELMVDLPAESRIVSLDANLFHRVLDNLISNAIKFSPPRSSVQFKVQYLDADNGPQDSTRQVRIIVKDQGPGIPEAYRDRIFDKFEVVELMQREEIEQIGIGLAFCRMVVEAHGGRIFATGNEPTGTVFIVEI